MDPNDNELIKSLLERYQRSIDPSSMKRQQQMDLQQNEFDRMQNLPKPMGENPQALEGGYRALNQLGTLQGKTAPTDGLDFMASQPKPPMPAPPPLSTAPQGFQIDPKVMDYLKGNKMSALKSQADMAKMGAKAEIDSGVRTDKQAHDVNMVGVKADAQRDLLKDQGTAKSLENINKDFGKRMLNFDEKMGQKREDINALVEARNMLSKDNNLTGGRSILGDWYRGQSNPDALAAKDNVLKAIKNMFKEVLGGQFGLQEGENLERVYFNKNLPPEYNIKKINALLEQVLTGIDLMKKKSDYFKGHGYSLEGYDDPQLDQIINQMKAAAAGQDTAAMPPQPRAPGPSGTTGHPPAVNPSMTTREEGSELIKTPDGKSWRKLPNGHMQEIR